MHLLQVRTAREMQDAALLLRAMEKSIKEGHPDQFKLLDDCYRCSWILDESPGDPPATGRYGRTKCPYALTLPLMRGIMRKPTNQERSYVLCRRYGEVF
jgi:hypothetical protein